MKNILIINGHPNSESFNSAIHKAFKKGLATNGTYIIDEIKVADLDFNINLSKGYSSETIMEIDLIEAQEKIKKADHIVWIFPLWWGTMPALLKGFIDRIFVPGFAFKYHANSISSWDKLLKGKTTEIICTLDYPVLIFKLFMYEGGIKVMRRMIFNFCGLKSTQTTYLGPIRSSKLEQRNKWLKKVELMGARM